MFFCISTLSVSQRSTSSSASRSSASSFSSHHFYWCQPRANFVKTKCTYLTCYAMLTLPLNQFYAVHIFHISLFCQFVFLSSIFCFVLFCCEACSSWILVLQVTAAASGLGYMISTTFPPKHGPFITVTALVIATACNSDQDECQI